MQSVIETPTFSRRADALLSQEERFDLISTLAGSPHAGDLIPGQGGLRKLRFAGGGRGKRGAFQVIYYVASEALPILALLIYGKNEQSKPTAEQTKAMSAVVAILRETINQNRNRGSI